MNKKFYVIPQVKWADLTVESNFVQTVTGKTVDDWTEDENPINL